MGAKKGIGYSSLSDKVYLGGQNPKKGLWVGPKEDITSDFLTVAMQFFEPGTVRTVTAQSSESVNTILNIEDTDEGRRKALKHIIKMIKDKKVKDEISTIKKK